MTRVTLDDLTKRYDDGVVAANGIDLEVQAGEFLVIVGPSGCGKSTTLRLVAGLERPTSGRVCMAGRDVSDEEPKDRNVAMVFQNYALYPHMTGRRNMTFGMQSAGEFTDEEVEERVREAAEMLDIADLLDRKPEAMSGGERQRVALGRAIVRDPDVFLMDEPLSNLDAKLRGQMRAELATLHAELQTTTIYVTHDQTEAMTLGDRVVVMNDGRIQQVDPPQQLYDYQDNRFVAEFVGDPAMNTLPVTTATDGDRQVLAHPAFDLPLPPHADLDRPQGSPVVLGIRPEDLALADDDGSATLTATVQLVEPLGDTLLLECAVGDESMTVQTEPRRDVEQGEQIRVSHDPERLHVFDDETGETIFHAGSGRPRPGPQRQSQSATD